MEEEKLLFYITKLQKTIFLNTEDMIFTREIVYPIYKSEKDIYCFLSGCLDKVKSIKLQKAEQSLCVVNLYKKEQDTLDSVSTYWIDGISFLISYQSNEHLLISIDIDLNTETIFKIIESEIICSSINHIDELGNCWIKRLDW